MALRDFTDSKGTSWQVWRVQPTTGAAFLARDRREGDAHPDAEPRSRQVMRTSLTPGLEAGWLCFESTAEKRRLAPVPTGWDTCSEADLEALLLSARIVSRSSEEAKDPEPDPIPPGDG